MTPERWQQISRIFKSAILLDNEARAAYVASQCGRDDSLRVEVENLIDSHGKADADEFMNGVAAEAAAPLLTDDEIEPRQDIRAQPGQSQGRIYLPAWRARRFRLCTEARESQTVCAV